MANMLLIVTRSSKFWGLPTGDKHGDVSDRQGKVDNYIHVDYTKSHSHACCSE